MYPGKGTVVLIRPAQTFYERIKLVYRGVEGDAPCCYGAVSPDGLRWTTLESPLFTGYSSDTHNVVQFDPEKERYVGYFRGWVDGRRTIAYAETDWFETWPLPETIVAPDGNDSPDTDIYTNSYSPWPGANAHLMFPAFYRRSQDIHGVHLMTSRDGRRWERLSREPIIADGGPGSDFIGGIFGGSGVVNLGQRESAIAITPRSWTHNQFQFPKR